MNYKFVSKFNNETTSDSINYFYQLCTFKNPKTKKYCIRRFTINGNNEFIDIRDGELDSRDKYKFIKTHKSNEYKLYGTYDLTYIDYPVLTDILLLKSSILAKDADYTGYALV